jgi:hypothetical protein
MPQAYAYKKYGTAKEAEQMFNKVIKPTAPKKKPPKSPEGGLVNPKTVIEFHI